MASWGLVMKHNTRGREIFVIKTRHKTCQNESNTHVIVKQTTSHGPPPPPHSPFLRFFILCSNFLCSANFITTGMMKIKKREKKTTSGARAQKQNSACRKMYVTNNMKLSISSNIWYNPWLALAGAGEWNINPDWNETIREDATFRSSSISGLCEEHKNLCKWHKFQVKSFMSEENFLCFFSSWRIGLTIIKMMTPLRAYSCLLQVCEFVGCRRWRATNVLDRKSETSQNAKNVCEMRKARKVGEARSTTL